MCNVSIETAVKVDLFFQSYTVRVKFRDLWENGKSLLSFMFGTLLTLISVQIKVLPWEVLAVCSMQIPEENCRYRKEDRSGDPWASRDPFWDYSGPICLQAISAKPTMSTRC
ncbi:uncharacterized protein LOC143424188 [Xylocopa sonorina]|uniref:uncharacterized protein LOC143424188 n=1 Tax=Xylocopa sonorina TaxID=1818115 RepID=UPI00403AA6DA